MEAGKPSENVATIGKSVVVKGELSGSEDLHLDGEVEGSINLAGNSLSIGPNGKVKAHISARQVVVHGKVTGNIKATDRIELKATAAVVGDLATKRILVEDGAYFKGGVDIQRDGTPETKSAPAQSAAAVSTAVTK